MAGHQRITASGALGVSGKPTRVFGYSQMSLATGTGLVTLYNDTTSTTSNETFQRNGVANESSEVTFGQEGKFFPSGCYVTLDSDVSYVDFDYETTQA